MQVSIAKLLSLVIALVYAVLLIVLAGRLVGTLGEASRA